MKILLLVALFAALILVGLLCYLLFFILGFFVSVNNEYRQAKCGIDVFFSSNGMHIDILLPTSTEFLNWPDYICSKDFEHGLASYPYLSIGWGDYGFFLELESWDKLTADIAFRALLKPNTPTLMHVSGLKKLPSKDMKIAKLTLSKQEYLGLCSYIYSYFETDSQGQLKLLNDKGYTPDDNFYAAIGSYSALHTCNYWVNKGLKKIGVRTALWSPLEKGVFYHLEKLAQQKHVSSNNKPPQIS
jgi:uncharacterized protein (TIGR02117 family)